jgi:hypothetical protein
MIDTKNMSREVLERAIAFARARRDRSIWRGDPNWMEDAAKYQGWQKCVDGLEARLAEKPRS